MIPFREKIIGFLGERVVTKGYIDFPKTFGRRNAIKTIKIGTWWFCTSYNALLGRSSLNKLGAIVSTPHLAMKFPTEKGDVATISCGRFKNETRVENDDTKRRRQKCRD